MEEFTLIRSILNKFLLTLTAVSLLFNILSIPTICEGKTDFGFKQQAEIYAQKGYTYRKEGNIQEAIKYQQKAAYLNPEYAFPHNELGILYEIKGWLNRAEKEYKEAIIIDPQFLSAYVNLALFYESKGQIKEAIYYWKKIVKLASDEDEWMTLSMKKLKEYDPDLKKEVIEETIEQAKIYILIESARKFLLQGEFESALDELYHAQSLQPENIEVELLIDAARLAQLESQRGD